MPDEQTGTQVVKETRTVPSKILGVESETKKTKIPPKSSTQQEDKRIEGENQVQGKKEDKAPESIYLCGKNLTPTLLSKIQKKINLKPVILKTNISQIPQGRESELAILLSLAQKEVSPPEDEKSINILPKFLSLKYKTLAQKNLEKTFQVLACFSLLFFTSLTFAAYFKLNREKRMLSTQVATLEKMNTSLPTSFSARKIALLSQVSKQNKALQEVLGEIFKNTPSEIKISGINFNKEKSEIILVGRAKTREELLTFKDSLSKSQFFQKIFVPLSSLKREKEVEFRMIITISNFQLPALPTGPSY